MKSLLLFLPTTAHCLATLCAMTDEASAKGPGVPEIRSNHGIIGRVFMPLWAVCYASLSTISATLRSAILKIISLGPEKDVMRVHALPIVARMACEKPVSNWTIVKLVAEPVRTDRSTCPCGPIANLAISPSV